MKSLEQEVECDALTRNLKETEEEQVYLLLSRYLLNCLLCNETTASGRN